MCKIDWSKEFVYYLGFLWADGSVKRSGVRLEIIEEDMLDIIDSLNKIDFLKLNIYTRKREGFKPTIQLYFCDVKLYDSFFTHYYKEKSIKSPDDLIDVIPSNLIRYFFNGLVDGDGNFYISGDLKTKQFSIVSTFDQDWYYIEKLFNELDIKKYEIVERMNKRGKGSAIRVSNYNDIYKLYKYLYPNGFEIGLRRKYDKCKLMIDNKPKYTCNNEFLKKEDLLDKIEELKDIKSVCEYFNCSINKIINYCKKYNITNKGFTRNKKLSKDDYMTLSESKKYMIKFGLKSKKEWVDFCKRGERPKNIPSNPFLFYKDDWVSYGDWLGF